MDGAFRRSMTPASFRIRQPEAPSKEYCHSANAVWVNAAPILPFFLKEKGSHVSARERNDYGTRKRRLVI